MMLKIEDVKIGDELECIDLSKLNENLSKHGNFIVTKVESHRIWIDDKFTLFKYELGIFKKKEQSQYAFDDLIDVAVQANKDRVINGFSVVGGVLNCQTLDGEDYNLGIGCEVAHGIEYLQSLYKETFVICSINDAKRLNNGAKTTLKNGEVIYFQNIDDGDFWFTFNDYGCEKFPFLALKGATVEQSK